MSVNQTALVWGLKLRPAELLVMLCLADHAHPDGTHAFPSVARIAARVNISERTVQRVLRTLEKQGLLEKDPRSGQSSANKYTLHAERGVNNLLTTRGRQNVRGASSDTPGVTAVTPRGVTAVTPEPSVEPSGIRQSVVRGVDEGGTRAQTAAANRQRLSTLVAELVGRSTRA